MHPSHLLITSPLITTLVFGSIGVSHASVMAAPVSPGETHAAATSHAVPPICRKIHKDEKPICADGYSDGFEAGTKCGPPRQTGRYSDDEAYDVGYAAGYKSGKKTCPPS
ncbi:hypothetical protein GCM10009850_083830 [Nonomuraea monospora]|uniref:Uncharacterized protein n=1 Tax=Nonomuraea monospora TaxID=568818 RepID=A0ABP5PMK4_9ACTN